MQKLCLRNVKMTNLLVFYEMEMSSAFETAGFDFVQIRNEHEVESKCAFLENDKTRGQN